MQAQESAEQELLDALQDEAYTLRQAADELGKSLDTIRDWLDTGEFPHAYKDGPKLTSAWKIPQRDIDGLRARLVATMPASAWNNDNE